MSDQSEVTTELRGTVGLARKISDGNYGSYEFQLFLPVPFDPDRSVEAQAELVTSFFELAKELLGKQTEPILANLVAQSFTAPAVASAPRAAASNGQQAPTVLQFCKTCGTDVEAYDNRAKIADGTYKPNAPKFKGKVCKHGIWDTEKPVAASVGSSDEPF